MQVSNTGPSPYIIYESQFPEVLPPYTTTLQIRFQPMNFGGIQILSTSIINLVKGIPKSFVYFSNFPEAYYYSKIKSSKTIKHLDIKRSKNICKASENNYNGAHLNKDVKEDF